MNDKIKSMAKLLVGEIDMAMIQLGVTDTEIAMYHLDRAKKQLEEMQREVWLLEHRSGEVK